MLGVEDLYKQTDKPIISKISLKLLQDYYETYLSPFLFRFETKDGSNIDLKFDKKRFCHLLGIETIAKANYKKNERQLKLFRGEIGYKRVENGEITFQSLKNLSKSMFKSCRIKFDYFYCIPHLLESPNSIFKFKQVKGSNVQCEFLIYNQMHGVVIHLGIEKDDSGDFYNPRTFLVEKITKHSDGMRFVSEQSDEIEIEAIKKFSIATQQEIK